MLKVKALAGKDMIYTFPGNFHRNEERLKAFPLLSFPDRYRPHLQNGPGAYMSDIGIFPDGVAK